MPKPAYLTVAASIEALAVIASGKSNLSSMDLANWGAVIKKKYENFPKVQPFSCPVSWASFVVILHRDDIPEYIDKKAGQEFTSIAFSGGKITLVNDVDNAGADKVYAQNASGAKGWYDWETVWTSGGGETVAPVENHDLLSDMHSDTVSSSPSKDALIIGNPENKWARLDPPKKQSVLLSDKGTIKWGAIPAKHSIQEGSPWPRLVTSNGVPSSSWDEGRYYYGTNNKGERGFWNWAKVDCKEEEPPKGDPKDPGGPKDPGDPDGPGGPVDPVDRCSCGNDKNSISNVVIHPSAAQADFRFVRECTNPNIEGTSYRVKSAEAIAKVYSSHNCSGTQVNQYSSVMPEVKVTIAPGKGENSVVITVSGRELYIFSNWTFVPNGGSMCLTIKVVLTCGDKTIEFTGSNHINKSNEGNPRPPDNCEGFAYTLRQMHLDDLERAHVFVSFSRCLQGNSTVMARGTLTCDKGTNRHVEFVSEPIPDAGCTTEVELVSPMLLLPEDSACTICIREIVASCHNSGVVTNFAANQCYNINLNNGPDNPVNPMDNPGIDPDGGPDNNPGNPLGGPGPIDGEGGGPIFPDDDGGPIGGGDGGNDVNRIPNPELVPVPHGFPMAPGVPDEIKDEKKWKAPKIIGGGRANVKVVRERLKIKLPWFNRVDNSEVVTSVNHPNSAWRARIPGPISFNKGSFTNVMGADLLKPLGMLGGGGGIHPDSLWSSAYITGNLAADTTPFVYRFAPDGKIGVKMGQRVGYCTVNISISVPKEILKDFKFGTEDNEIVKKAIEARGDKDSQNKYIVTFNGLAFMAAIRFKDGTGVHTFLNSFANTVTDSAADIETSSALTSLHHFPSTTWFSILLPYDEGATKSPFKIFEPKPDNKPTIYGCLGAGFPTYGLSVAALQFVRRQQTVNHAAMSKAQKIAQLSPIYFERGHNSSCFNQITEIQIAPVMIFIRKAQIKPIRCYRIYDEALPAPNQKALQKIEEDPNNQKFRRFSFADEEIPIVGVAIESQQAGNSNLRDILSIDPMGVEVNLYKVPLDYIHPAAGADFAIIPGEQPTITIEYTIRAVYV